MFFSFSLAVTLHMNNISLRRSKSFSTGYKEEILAPLKASWDDVFMYACLNCSSNSDGSGSLRPSCRHPQSLTKEDEKDQTKREIVL